MSPRGSRKSFRRPGVATRMGAPARTAGSCSCCCVFFRAEAEMWRFRSLCKVVYGAVCVDSSGSEGVVPVCRTAACALKRVLKTFDQCSPPSAQLYNAARNERTVSPSSCALTPQPTHETCQLVRPLSSQLKAENQIAQFLTPLCGSSW